MEKIIEIPEGYEARIDGNKVVLELKESEDEKIPKLLHELLCAEVTAGQFEKHGLTVDDALYWLEKQKEQKPKMIQWTGNNLKEVIDFTGKSPRFDEWFKSWEEYENYVHSHNDILKLFCEDGSHYEVPVGSCIVKTPDGFNIPSHSKFVQKPTEKISVSEELYEHIRNACACIEDAMSSDTLCDMTDYLEMANSSAQKAFDMVERSVVKQPAEWSEDDEKMRDNTILSLQYLVDIEGIHEGFLKNAKRQIAWLKSLHPQPHWKPSKEQIALLEIACKYEGVFTPGQLSALRDLKEQLKKL